MGGRLRRGHVARSQRERETTAAWPPARLARIGLLAALMCGCGLDPRNLTVSIGDGGAAGTAPTGGTGGSEPPVHPTPDAGPEAGMLEDCCELPAAEGGCSDTDEACAPAG